MKYLTILAGVALCFASCTTNSAEKSAENEAADQAATEATVDGQWKLAKYNVDGTEVNVDAEKDFVISFVPADSTFSMTTSCNNIGGKYIVNGDSIKFDNLFATRMMCPDMSVEDAMNKVLADATVVKFENDSTLQLINADTVLAQFSKTTAAPEEHAAE